MKTRKIEIPSAEELQQLINSQTLKPSLNGEPITSGEKLKQILENPDVQAALIQEYEANTGKAFVPEP